MVTPHAQLVYTLIVGDGFLVEEERVMLLRLMWVIVSIFIDRTVDGVEESRRERWAVLVVVSSDVAAVSADSSIVLVIPH